MSHRYRGKRPSRKIWIALGLAAVVIALAVILAVFVLPDYLISGDDGSLKLRIPNGSDIVLKHPPAVSSEPEPPEESDVNVVVITAVPSTAPNNETEPPDVSGVPEVSTPPQALWVSQEVASDSGKRLGLKNALAGTAINMLVVDVKSDEGLLLTPEIMEAVVAELRSERVTIVGRLSCFVDNTYPRENGAVGVKHSSGVNWLDNKMRRWLNPYKAEARSYIVESIQTAEAAGFDALLLDNICFPHTGKLTAINYGGDGRISHSAAIGEFLELLSVVTTPIYGVVSPGTLSEGMDADAGQEAARFRELFEILFVPVPLENAYEVWTGVSAGGNPESLVPILNNPPSAGGASPEENLQGLMGAVGGTQGFGYLVVDEKGAYPYGAFE